MAHRAYIGIFAFLTLIVAVSCYSEESMFSMFKKVDVEVFPEVIGSLTHEGKPLPGIKLKRGYQYSGVMEEKEWDYTTTDAEGKFSFPEIIYSTAQHIQISLLQKHVYLKPLKSLKENIQI
uniref:DUF6795 domain-containing protein n=1 Tax=Shewanella ulleungensis TaxID=2282699 RepID=UPI003D79E426